MSSAIPLIPLQQVCSQDRQVIAASARHDLKYVGMESVEPHTGRLIDTNLSKTPENPIANSFFFSSDHVLYGKLRPYLNKVYVPTAEGKCSTELIPLRPTNGLDRQYLGYFLRAPGTVKMISQRVAGARMPRADMDFVMSLRIPLPPIDQQKQIAGLLSRAERIARMRQGAEAKANEIVRALFVEMFGDPRHNPKGYELIQLGDVLPRIEGGKNVQAGNNGDSPYRILKISAVTSGDYDESQSKPAPSEYSPPDHYFVRDGDMLFSRANTEELVGATVMVRATDGKSLLPDKLWRLVWQKDRVRPEYMLALLQNRSTRQVLSKISSGTGGAMKNIPQARLLDLRLPIAPYDQQTAFERRAANAGNIQRLIRIATRAAHRTYESLLSRAFSPDGLISER